MHRQTLLFSLAGLGLLLTIPSDPSASAEEPPHLEFARGLRSRGLADLALEYLEKISKEPRTSADPFLLLELAKTRLELAAGQANAARRAAWQNQAKTELALFIDKNPKHPLAADAALEMARITGMQAKALLSKGHREEARAIQLADFRRARTQFEEAAQQLAAAAGRIDAQLKTLEAGTGTDADNEKKALGLAKLRADLELAVNLLDQAQTYVEDSELPRRGEIVKQALGSLEKISRRKPASSLTWQALAWVGRCHLENDDPAAARKVFAEVMNEKAEDAADGRRLARYFRLAALARDSKNPYVPVQQAGEEWLKMYPGFLNTMEGYGVRFELANSYFDQAAAMPAAQRRSGAGQRLLQRAQKLYQELEQGENDYTNQSRERKLRIILTLSQERTRGKIAELRDFEECYLRAQLEIAQLNQETKQPPDKEKLEDLRKRHYDNIVRALTRGLDLVSSKIRPDDVADARYLLTYAYLATGDYYRAAVLGEELSRRDAASSHAAPAGTYALRAYAYIIAKEEQPGVAKEDIDADRRRLESLARYIEQTWPGDSAADVARHMLGFSYLGLKDYAKVVEVLERISPAYPDATRSLYQLAGAALQAQKEQLAPPPGKAPYRDRAIAALLRVPELTAGADSETVQGYVNGKLLLADLYYKDRQYGKVAELADRLLKQVEGLDESTKAEHRTNVYALVLYAKLGQAEAAYKAGRFTQSREMLDPTVKELTDPAHASLVADLKQKDPGILRAVLGLALRANIQDSRIVQGREILDLLQKTFPDNSNDIMVQLVGQLREQIKDLRQQGQPAEEQLKKTVDSFSTFLDQLTKQQEKSPRPEVMLFLAQSYSSLDNHARAAELANSIPEPEKKDDARALQLYHLARILQARELRLAREFGKAKTELDKIAAAPWGKTNLEVMKEKVFWLEDQDRLGGRQGAVAEWDKLMRTLKPRLGDNKIKEQYFDCYYHLTYCIYKSGLNESQNLARRQRDIQTAARFIVKIETQPDVSEDIKKRFAELLDKEKLLKQQYDKEKAK
jgi:hypothetical protein